MPDIVVGLSTLFCFGEPFEKALKIISGMELEFVELVDDLQHELNEARVRAVRKLANNRGMRLGVHCPFAGVNITAPIKEIRRATLNRLKRSIVMAGQLDSEVWVLHPGLRTGIQRFYPGLEWQLNKDAILELLDHAREHDVKIVLENMPGNIPFILRKAEEFRRFLGELDVRLDLVLDIGHAHISGETTRFLEEFRGRIAYMHAHDNDGERDLHQGIGYGTIDWHKTAQAIKNSGFRGTITVESVEHVEESVKRLKNLLL